MAEETYTVQRSATIAAPPQRVYDEIADFHNWPHWSPWEELDPAMHRDYSGADSGAGAAYAWSGNRKAGRGRMTITEATAPSLVRVDLVFEKPMRSHNETWFTIRPEGAGCRVTWAMTGRKSLVTKALGLVKSMDAMVGPDFEKGLARLRAAAER